MALLLKDTQYLGLPSAPTGSPTGYIKIYYDAVQKTLLQSIDGSAYGLPTGPTSSTLAQVLRNGNSSGDTGPTGSDIIISANKALYFPATGFGVTGVAKSGSIRFPNVDANLITARNLPDSADLVLFGVTPSSGGMTVGGPTLNNAVLQAASTLNLLGATINLTTSGSVNSPTVRVFTTEMRIQLPLLTFDQTAVICPLDGSNVNASITLRGRQSLGTTGAAGGGNTFVAGGPVSSASGCDSCTGGILTLSGGDADGATGANTGGVVQLRGGNATLGTGTSAVGGQVLIKPGTGGTNGTANVNFVSVASGFQGMQNGLFIANCTSVPTGGPLNGGFFYVASGALKYMGQSGTSTHIGNA